MPGAVLVAAAAAAGAGLVVMAGLACTGAALAAGAEFRGAPTAISQRCPGWPCGGLVPADATGTVPAGTAAVAVGIEKLSVANMGAAAVPTLSCLPMAGVPRLGSDSGSLSLLLQAVNSKHALLMMRKECFIVMYDI